MPKDAEDTHLGRWWSPEYPERRSSGNLHVYPDGRLSLNLAEPIELGITQVPEVPIVLGLTAQGAPITIVDSYVVLHEFPSQIGRTVLWPSQALFGIHLPSKQDVVTRRARFQLTALRAWLGRRSIEWRIDGSDHVFAVRSRDPIRATLGAGEILFLAGATTHADSWSVTLDETAGVEFAARESLQVDQWFEQILYPLRNFIALATTRPSEISSVGLLFDVEDSPAGWAHPVDVVDRRTRRRPEEPPDVWENQMLFTYEDIAERLHEVLTRWLTSSDSLKSVTGPFFSTVYSPQLYVEQRFLALVRAFEAYHRLRQCEPIVPAREWTQVRRSAVRAVPDVHKTRVREALSHGHEHTLRERLLEVSTPLDAILEGFELDRGHAAQLITKIRNSLAHGLGGTHGTTAHPEIISACSDLLFAIVQACLLQELGFSGTAAAERVAATEDFLIAKRRWRQRSAGLDL